MYGNDYSEMKLSQEQQRRIEDCIEFRFYSSLRFSMITDWLRNFDDREIDMAISILEHIDYYRTEDISSIMMNGLYKLLALRKQSEAATKNSAADRQYVERNCYICSLD